jgi:hypothetical protein
VHCARHAVERLRRRGHLNRQIAHLGSTRIHSNSKPRFHRLVPVLDH